MPTEAKDIFEAHSKSLREMLTENGLGLYLPPYQRPYGWSRDKVEKLVDDALHGLKNLGSTADSFTFLGTIITIHDVNHVTVQPVVKTEVPAKVLTVIDGQQRLSSLLLLIVCLHNQIRQRHWSVFGGKAPDPDDTAMQHLHAETVTLLQGMGATFYERQQIGDSPIYPRLIRAFQDQWAKSSKLSKYSSPIARLLSEYANLADSEDRSAKPTDFRPPVRDGVGDGETDLIKRFTEVRAILNNLALAKRMEKFEDLPSLSVMATNKNFQRALFNHELDPSFCEWLSGCAEPKKAELVRLVMFGAYVLQRIALTVVKGKDEDYAFTIFESLNTTGEPLTAFETFLPRVVMAEGLEDYRESEAHGYMVDVQQYLSRFPVGDRLQNATRELLVSFALAETGTKLSKRLADQRLYLKDAFEPHKDSAPQRTDFLRHLRYTASFIGSAWDPVEDASSQLVGLDAAAMTDVVRLCLLFLKDLNHTIAIAPLVRFYSEAVNADSDTRRSRVAEFEEAVKAVTAFTVFWRASRRGTGNIDSEYREIMSGASPVTALGPLARVRLEKNLPPPAVNASGLKAEFVARLTDNEHGGLPNLATFVTRALSVPMYTQSRPLTRFLLLAAYHDAVEDPEHAGLIRPGKPGSGPCLTADGWKDETHLTVEHIAPQSDTSGWDRAFYADKEAVHKIGNLVLAPAGANSSLSSRPWEEKRVLYGALGATSPEEAKEILEQAQAGGMTFAQTTEELVQLSRYMPHLRALRQRTEPWDTAFIEERGRSLLKLAYARLSSWIGLDWPEAEDAPVDVAPETDDEDAEQD